MNKKVFNAVAVFATFFLLCVEDSNAGDFIERLRRMKRNSTQKKDEVGALSNDRTDDLAAYLKRNSVSRRRRRRRLAGNAESEGRATQLPPIRKMGANYDNVPVEIVRQFGGDVPQEIVSQYQERASNGTSEPTKVALPYHVNVPQEIITQYRGIVPNDVVEYFNQQAQAAVRARLPPSPKISQQDGKQGAGDERLSATLRGVEASGVIGTGVGGKFGNSKRPPPVKFGQFNYDYIIKPPAICEGGKDPEKKEEDEKEEEEKEEVTTTVPPPPPPPSPGIPFTGKQKERILKELNMYRATRKPTPADMRALSWDDELSWISETFTNSCYYRDVVEPEIFHPNGSQISPAIQLRRHSYYATEIGHTWFAWPKTYKLPKGFITSSIDAWDSEKVFYDKETKRCGAICEHFMQINWAESFKVGCSASWCENPNVNGIDWPQAILFVCSFTPRGGLANFMAVNHGNPFLDPGLFIQPYVPGKSCSLCVLDPDDPDQKIEDMRTTEDRCWNDLCANSIREQHIPFVPPARTSTQLWVHTPAPTTIPKTTTTKKDVENYDDNEDGSSQGDYSSSPRTVMRNTLGFIFLCSATTYHVFA